MYDVGFSQSNSLNALSSDDIKNLSNEKKHLIEQEIDKIIQESYTRTKKILTDNLGALHELYKELQVKKEIFGYEFKEMLKKYKKSY